MSSLESLARPSALAKPQTTQPTTKVSSISVNTGTKQQQEESKQRAAGESPNPDVDKRLELIGHRKSGYCGHVPRCIYYDRERIPASIHMGNVIPSRGRLQLDGSYMPTQSMVKDQGRMKQSGHFPVASLNEIGLARRGQAAQSACEGETSSPSSREDVLNLSRPFSRKPDGPYGHYHDMKEVGYTASGSGGEFSSTISPPRSPTSRYYNTMSQSTTTSSVSIQRNRHVGAGGVVSGHTPLKQYGSFLHHNDEAIHGAERHLLPQIYGALDKTRPLSPKNVRSDFNGSLRSQPENFAKGEGVKENRSALSAPPTPFPRYPVLRGPNRMGPRGLETFLTN